MLVTHDLGVVASMADRVVVMRGGYIVETGPVGRVLKRPENAYTQALLSAVPRVRVAYTQAPPSAVPQVGSIAHPTGGWDWGGHHSRGRADASSRK
ncbi:MAG: hypothetical protein WDO68_28805 [Gammaproteobacteria bacterium]